MANVKINDLAVIADPASTDVLPIVDVTLDTTNKISIADILKTVPEGTAAAPAIAFEGDSNTGIYHPGSEQIGFATSGLGRVFIASDGSVGVGTTDPDELLHIRGDVAEFKGTNTNSIDVSVGTEQVFKFGIEGQKNAVFGPTGSIIFRQDSGTWSSVEPNLKPTRIEFCTQDNTTTDTSETPRLVVDQNGRVGIGTTDPPSTLSVVSSNANTEETLAEFGNQTIANGLQIQTSGNLDWGFNVASNRNLTFSTNQNENLRIDSDGRVGIGTTLPEANLHIKGNVNTELRIEDQGEYVSLLYNDNGSTISVGVLNADNGNTSVADTELRIGVDGASRYVTKADGSHTFYQTDGSTESMRITFDGKVGIGATVPTSILNVKSPLSNTAETVAAFGNSTIADGLEIITNGNLDWGFNAKNSRNLTFRTNQTDRIRITSGGLVGIGTTGDPVEKLEVNGTIKATDINFTGLATYADDSAAGTGGLVAGDVYKTSTGELRIKL